MRGWFCPSTIQVTGQSCLTGFKAMTRYSPCKCYKDITLITPAPPPPKFKLQLPKTTSQTKRGDEVAGVFFFFCFLLFFSFSLFWGSCFPLSIPEGFQSMCKKNKTKTNLNTQIHPRVNITRPVGAQQQKDEICVQSLTDLNRPARLLQHPVTLHNELSHLLWNFSNNQLVHNSPAQSEKREGGPGGNERSGRQRLDSIFLFFLRILPAENALVL